MKYLMEMKSHSPLLTWQIYNANTVNLCPLILMCVFPCYTSRAFSEPMRTLSPSIRWPMSKNPVSSSFTTVHSRPAGIGWSCWPLSTWPSRFPITFASQLWKYERTAARQRETHRVSAISWWRYFLSLVSPFEDASPLSASLLTFNSFNSYHSLSNFMNHT